jgi:hypothetical protein
MSRSERALKSSTLGRSLRRRILLLVETELDDDSEEEDEDDDESVEEDALPRAQREIASSTIAAMPPMCPEAALEDEDEELLELLSEIGRESSVVF